MTTWVSAAIPTSDHLHSSQGAYSRQPFMVLRLRAVSGPQQEPSCGAQTRVGPRRRSHPTGTGPLLRGLAALSPCTGELFWWPRSGVAMISPPPALQPLKTICIHL